MLANNRGFTLNTIGLGMCHYHSQSCPQSCLLSFDSSNTAWYPVIWKSLKVYQYHQIFQFQALLTVMLALYRTYLTLPSNSGKIMCWINAANLAMQLA